MWVDFRGGRFNYLFRCVRLCMGHLLSIIVTGSIPGAIWETSGCKWILEAVDLTTSLAVADSVQVICSPSSSRRKPLCGWDWNGDRAMYLFDSGQALFPSDLFPPSGTWFLKSNVSDHCSELISSRSHYRFACPLKCSSQRYSGLHFLSFILTFAAA